MTTSHALRFSVRRTASRWLLVLSMVGGLIGLIAAPAAAASVDITGRTSLHLLVKDYPSGTGTRCNALWVAYVPDVKGADFYDVEVKDTGGGHGPYVTSAPYPNDAFNDGDVLWYAPSGEHQIPMAEEFGPTCSGAEQGEAGRYTLTGATAYGANNNIQGRVLKADGQPVVNAAVTLCCGEFDSGTVRTSASGWYEFAHLSQKVYTVKAAGATIVTACGPSGAVTHGSCELHLGAPSAKLFVDGTANFQQDGHVLAIHLTPETITADGTQVLDGVISDRTTSGVALAGEAIDVTPPLTSSPAAVVCTPTGLAYPTLLSDGTALGAHFTRTTDENGEIHFQVYVGSQAGSWLVSAAEVKDPSVTSTVDPAFTMPAHAAFPGTNLLPDLTAVGHSLVGDTASNLFSAGIGTPPAQVQQLLLAALQARHNLLPDVDFGPVHTATLAGVLFYPRGGDPAAGVVVDTSTLAGILDDVGLGEPVPPALTGAILYTAQWQQSVGAGQTVQHGWLTPVPNQALTYFGFPYPPLTADGRSTAAFASCLGAMPASVSATVHSPLTLEFRSADGDTFGLTAHHQPVGTAAGLVLHDVAADTTTYLLPAGAYKVSLLGTGKGRATVEIGGVRGRKSALEVYAFAAKAGGTGGLTVNGSATASGAVFAGRHLVGTAGEGLVIAGQPAALKAGHAYRLRLRLVDQFGRPVDGATVTVTGSHLHAIAVTDRTGHVSLAITPRGTEVTIAAAVRGGHGTSARVPVH